MVDYTRDEIGGTTGVCNIAHGKYVNPSLFLSAVGKIDLDIVSGAS